MQQLEFALLMFKMVGENQHAKNAYCSRAASGLIWGAVKAVQPQSVTVIEKL